LEFQTFLWEYLLRWDIATLDKLFCLIKIIISRQNKQHVTDSSGVGDSNLLCPLVFVLSKTHLHYLVFQYFDFELTRWSLFQQSIMRTNLDIYVFIDVLITVSEISLIIHFLLIKYPSYFALCCNWRIQNKQDTRMTPSMIYCMYSFKSFHQCILHCILHTMHRFAKSYIWNCNILQYQWDKAYWP
jgi:hypothetical protein